MTPLDLALELIARVRDQVDGLGGLLTESIAATLDELELVVGDMDKDSLRQADINGDLRRELDQVCPECRALIDSEVVAELVGAEA